VDPQQPNLSGVSELQSFRAEVLSRKDLPTIPVVLSRILAVVDGEYASARDLVEVIERDQALTSRVLKLANSALFGLSRKVATVPRAVVLVGFNTVRNLALGVKVWDTLLAGGSQRAHVAALWHHSALVAAGAKLVAARVRGCDPDGCFSAGLLHDIGKLVFGLKLGPPYWTLVGAVEDDARVIGVERAALKVDHAEVGGWLAEAWRLPPAIVAAIRDHHRDQLDRADWSATEIVSAANRLVHGTDLATGDTTAAAAAVLERAAAQGLTAEHWLELVRQLKDEADAISSLFTS
jgi:putative nucleotidyltransferase with HDIG domain